MTIGDFKKAFAGISNVVKLAASAVITLAATLAAILILSLLQGKAFGEYWSLGTFP